MSGQRRQKCQAPAGRPAGPQDLGKPSASPVGTAPSRPSRARERCTKPRRPPAPCGLSAGRLRGLRGRTPATQGERKIKQQPPHRSGRTRGKLALPRFPPAANTGNGNDALRERSLRAPRPGSPRGGCGGGVAPGSAPRLFVVFRLARSQPIAGVEGGACGPERQTPVGSRGNGGLLPRPAQRQRGLRGHGLETLLRAF